MRRIEEENTAVIASLTGEEGLILSLSPAVSSMEGHHHKRIAASLMYELAVRYAEKVNGVIQQISINVPACMSEGPQRTLAVYPETRFTYENLCPGFASVFMPGDES